MPDYGLLGEYNTDPMRGILADPRMAYRTQYRDQPLPGPIFENNYAAPVVPRERPADWAVTSGVAESISPTMGAYGMGHGIGTTANDDATTATWNFGAIAHGRTS